MKKLLLLAVLSLLAIPAVLNAQTGNVGLLLGKAEDMEDGFDFKFNDTVREAFFSTQLDQDTYLTAKLGRMDAKNRFGLGGDTIAPDGNIEYVDLLVSYRFDEVFGSTSMFAGPGYYRQKFGNFDEADYGLSAGVNGIFPVTRRFSLIAEAAYHWTHFEQRRTFVTASGGFLINF